MQRNALIIGAGSGLSASLARALYAEGYRVVLVARKIEKLTSLAEEIGALTYAAECIGPGAGRGTL